MLLREALPQDALGLHALEEAVVLDGRGVVLHVNDLLPLDAFTARHRQSLQTRFQRGQGLHLVAVEGAQLVGEGTLYALQASGIRHVGLLAVAVHPRAQGRGIGRQLVEALMGRAPAIGVERVELYVRADNLRAIRLYESVGFEEEGRRRAFVRLPSGERVDDLVMGCLLPLPR